jgi:hypothetical protein
MLAAANVEPSDRFIAYTCDDGRSISRLLVSESPEGATHAFGVAGFLFGFGPLGGGAVSAFTASR